ncbi:MAG: sugar phosphate isomerase/epimerase [Cyclobacteriaceae bacterium]|nr:sugar phosphate isomerase/epimerase [Cyclobacteriaceae bacterium]
MKRRTFLQTTSLAAVGLAALPSMAFAPKYPVGLQLYTLRDIIGKDPKGVCKMVADLGYKEFEAFGYNDGKLFGMTAKEFGAYVRDLGARVTSGHYMMGNSPGTKAMKGTVSNEWSRAVADAKETGQEFMVVAFLMPDERKSLDDYKRICEQLNKAGETCKANGIRLNYHNHAFEFELMDGQKPFDAMLASLDPSLVGIELDLYWTYFANENPLEYFKKHPGRFEQWHVKDMDKVDRKRNAIVGTGSIDFKSIFAQASLAGMKHFYVEHDTFPISSSSSESVKQAIKNVDAWM